MKITPFNEVNEAVQKASDWLSSIGIDVAGTRMGEYRKNITIAKDEKVPQIQG